MHSAEKNDGDLGLLIVVREGQPKRKTAQLLYSQIRNVKIPYDLIAASDSDPDKYGHIKGLIYYDAVKYGKVVYG
ncbi:MAG: hypothetical protein L6Q59_12310 [Ignavibacteriaceae bacterium]|nr:hypothetical protein [Ignavibacteriaceae bacterium]